MVNDLNASAELDYGRHYRRWHDDSDAHFKAMADWFSGLLRPYLPASKAARITEIGCGMGFALGALRQLGYSDIEGIDSDASQIAAAHYRSLPAKLVSSQSTDTYLRERPKQDLIFAVDVIEHIPRQHTIPFLISIREALSPGGRFVCQVPNCNSFIASRYRYIDWTHETSFSEASLDFVLHNSGFENIVISEATPNWRPSARRWDGFSPWLNWAIRSTTRSAMRMIIASELGWREARKLPLSPNIIGAATAP